MKALNFYAKRDIRFEEVAEPVIEKNNEVKIKIKAAGICGSDIHRYARLGPYVAGTVWGHECAGEVVEIGSAVKKVKVGEKVTVCPAFYCGECDSCRKSVFAQCEHLSVIGQYHPGAFAEYLVMPEENVVPVPENVPYDHAAMVEPACVVVHGLYKVNLNPGESVAIIGCGTIGNLAVQWAKIFGVGKIIAIDIDDEKLALAKKLGADIVINCADKEPFEEIYKVNNGKGVDVAVEAAGTAITSAQAFSLAGKGGRVLFVGIPYSDVMVWRMYFEKIVRNELQVYGSWNAVSAPFPGREWEAAVHFMATGQLNMEPLITHRLPLSKGFEAFEMTVNPQAVFGKIMFYPEQE